MKKIIFCLLFLPLFCFAQMPDNINKVIIQYEGSTYTNDPRDTGGPTKYGWTLNTYRQKVNPHATISTIQNLTKQEALDAYEKHFWDVYGTKYIKDEELSAAVLLAQINLGYKRPNVLLQKLTNTYCDSGLKEDGLLGPKAIHAINNCKATQIAFSYILFYGTYNNFKSMSWAKNGLRARVMHFTKNDYSSAASSWQSR